MIFEYRKKNHNSELVVPDITLLLFTVQTTNILKCNENFKAI